MAAHTFSGCKCISYKLGPSQYSLKDEIPNDKRCKLQGDMSFHSPYKVGRPWTAARMYDDHYS